MTIVKETQYRTIVKLVTYRLLAATATALLVMYYGASIYGALMFALTSLWLGGIIYYFHERAWLFTNFNRNVGNDGQVRSIVKTVTYRIAAMVAIFLTSLVLVTDKAQDAASLTLLLASTNLVLFYIIERIFNKIKWGKIIADI
jgi:uncharacterized membrane protein